MTETPEDFSPEKDIYEHTKKQDGGPGGIINYPKKSWPDGWEYVEGESSPKVED